jgi:mRNA-degrading endonuclease toxin of MazEF toxin-antitoxin module
MTAPIIKWWPAPEAGDLLWCHFPQIPGSPGPKPRPALVCAVDDGDPARVLVKVAYGTSQKTNRLHSGEFLISRQNKAAYALSGLSYDTKFDLKQIHLLPYNSLWFATAPGALIQTPVLGALHGSLMKALGAAWKAAGCA